MQGSRMMVVVVLVGFLAGNAIPVATATAAPQPSLEEEPSTGSGTQSSPIAQYGGGSGLNTSTSDNGSSSSNGSGDSVGYGPGSSLPETNNSSGGGVLSPAKLVTQGFGVITSHVQNDIKTLVAWFNGVFLSTTAPGDVSPGNFTAEITGAFGDMQDLRYNWFIFLSTALWIYKLVRMFNGGPERVQQEASECVSVLLVILLWDQFYPIIYHGADAFALGLAPSAEELTGSFSGLAKLGLSVIAIAGIVSYNVGLIGVAIMEVLIRDMILIYGAATVPFLYSLWKARIPYVGTLGQLAIAAWGIMLVFQPAMSVLLRLGFSLDWGQWAGTMGLPGAVVSPLASLAALTIATVGLPLLCLAAMYVGNPHKKVSNMGKKTSKKFRDKAKERGPDPKDVATRTRDTVQAKRPNPVQTLRKRREAKNLSYDDSAEMFDARSEAQDSSTARLNLDYGSNTSSSSSSDGLSEALNTPTYKMRGSSSSRSRDIAESLDD